MKLTEIKLSQIAFRDMNRALAMGTVCAACLLGASSVSAANDRGAIEGVVSNAAGQPVAGAFVRLYNPEKRITVMVISQDKGHFDAADLPAGNYTLQGVGAGFQSEVSAPVAVAAGGAAMFDLALKTKRGPALAASWPDRLPEAQVAKTSTAVADLPEGEGKAVVAEKCTVCHDAQRIAVKRTDRANWEHTIHDMRINMAAASLPDLSDADAATILNYVSAHFKPAHPYDANSRLPMTLAQGKGAHYRVVTYDLPKKYSEPHDIAADPTGVAWAGERAGKLVRFDPKTLEFTERDLPPGPAAPDRQRLGNPQIDSKGMLWAADGPNARWLSYDTVNRQYHSYPWPKGHGGAGGNTMAIDKDGTIWETGMGREVRMLNPATAEFKFFPAPSAKATGKNPGAYGMAIAGDGSAWWAEDDADMMARVDPATGKVEEFKIPLEGRILPRRMNSDWDGNLWVGLWDAGRLMKIDYQTKKMTIYTPPTPVAGNYSVVADKKNHVIWVSEQQVDKIARFDPKNGEWTEFPLPYAQSDPRRIDIDPTDPNRIYFSGNTADRIGFVEVLP